METTVPSKSQSGGGTNCEESRALNRKIERIASSLHRTLTEADPVSPQYSKSADRPAEL